MQHKIKKKKTSVNLIIPDTYTVALNSPDHSLCSLWDSILQYYAATSLWDCLGISITKEAAGWSLVIWWSVMSAVFGPKIIKIWSSIFKLRSINFGFLMPHTVVLLRYTASFVDSICNSVFASTFYFFAVPDATHKFFTVVNVRATFILPLNQKK